jgi:N-acetylneuraminate synthase
MKYSTNFTIDNHEISNTSSVFFIADLAANHDGSLQRAKDLISLAKEYGADAVKFQHFLADKIVSDNGFKSLGSQLGHQSKWEKSVFEIYKQYECNRDWSAELYETAKRENITFLTSPYDFEALDLLDQYLPAYKIGSGDITWHDLLKKIAQKRKPVLIATGASTMNETVCAVDTLLQYNKQIVLMQCNTNYTAEESNFKYINLNVLRSFALKYPMMPLGLSDHTTGHSTVLGAIALGACVIEKHFTDDNTRKGPDHPFAMNPQTWKEMVKAARELRAALGDGIKRIEENEQDTVILQRRCIRVSRDMNAGEILCDDDMELLRPATNGALSPYHITDAIGQKLLVNKKRGDALYPNDLLTNKDINNASR